jgi:putative ABC transport system substrate-binding protein
VERGGNRGVGRVAGRVYPFAPCYDRAAMMNRRRFLGAVSAGLLAAPVAAEAQQADRMRRIGVLTPFEKVPEFSQALADLGWIDGRNVRMDVRWGGGDVNRMQVLAKKLVGLQPDVILASTVPVTAALQRETRTIPIVFVHVADPVASGFVAKINQPGGNITGVGYMEASVVGKLLELLSEIAPGLKRAAIMFNPDTTAPSVYIPPFETAARSLKVVPIIAPVHSDLEIETTIVALGREPRGGLVVMPDTFMNVHRVPIISAAARNNVPAVYWLSAFARIGGLLSYGVDLADTWRRAATYVDRILRGAKPGDLPVQYPVKYEMAVNLRTAKALGLTIPQSLLGRADHIIE